MVAATHSSAHDHAAEIDPSSSTGLLTDHYELTMLDAALRDGTAHQPVAFEVFARRLPPGRRYGVLAGTGRLLGELAEFSFPPQQLSWLAERRIVSAETLTYLEKFRFRGDVDGYAEGECYLPGSPLLSVRGTFAETVLVETLVLSVLNFDSAVAAGASRVISAAQGRPCLEMGSRRTHERAAVAAARAAYLAGFEATSNLAAGFLHGIPTVGTSAHAFTLLHQDERTAFAAQVAAMGINTTLLVDTYDVMAGVRTAIEVAGPELGGVRLDSGDLLTQARQVRALLDSLGATATRIVVTSDLDEHAVAALAVAPVDAYGVGTSLVTGSGAPTAGMVYKMVARADRADPSQMIPVAKASPGKASHGGVKQAGRLVDDGGVAVAELVSGVGPITAAGLIRPLIVPLLRGGQPTTDQSANALTANSPTANSAALARARAHHRAALAELPDRARQLQFGEPAIPTWVNNLSYG